MAEPNPLPALAHPGLPTDASRLTIHSLDVECSVPAGMADAAAAGRRLARAARERLPAALALALAPLDRAGDGVLLLRRLELDLDLDPTMNADTLASHWAAGLRDTLARLLEDRGDTDRGVDGLVRFADRRHWLARFVVDLAAGRAWQGWLHRTFDGLKALPLSAALRTALADPDADGAGALLLLDDAEAARVISSLMPGDATRLLAALAANGSDVPVDAALPALARAAGPGSPARQLAEAEPAWGALSLWLAGLRAAPLAGRRRLADVAGALAELIRIGRRDTPAAGALEARLLHADLIGVADKVGAETALALRPLLTLGSGALAPLLVAADPSRVMRSAPSSGEARWTRFGNAFLLLPLIAELPLSVLAAGWPQPDDADSAALLRWAVLAAAQGRIDRAACLRDPLIADLCGVGPRTTAADLRRWLDAIDPTGVEAARARLLDWLGADPSRLLLARVGDAGKDADRASRTPPNLVGHCIDRVLLEAERGCWLRPFRAGEPWPSGLTGPAAAGPAQAATVAADLAFLTVEQHGAPGAVPAVDLFMAQLAQVVLKRLSFRLPGFANSSLRYLHRNFLGMDARMMVTEDHVDVALSPVPLQLVLGMTGAARRSLSLPWFTLLPVRLRRDGGR